MKKAAFAFLILTVNGLYGQHVIRIAAAANAKVTVKDSATLDADHNLILIDNQLGDCLVNISSGDNNAPFNFSFGKGANTNLKAGQNKFTFNSHGTVKGFPPTPKMELKPPFVVTVLDSNGNPVASEKIAGWNGGQTVAAQVKKDTVIQRIGLTQIPYYDALRLANYKQMKLKRQQFKEILSYYLPTKVYISNPDSLIERYKRNPYMAVFIAKAFNDSTWDPGAPLESPFPDLSGAAFSSIGGLNVTNFADGVAKFLVKRVKQELSIAFFRKLQQELAKSQELQTLLPQTYKVLLTMGTEIYQFSAYIQTIREAFVKDLTNLYVDFKKFKQLEKYSQYFATHPEINTLISTSLYLIDQYAAGVHAGDVLAGFDTADLNFRDSILTHNIRSSVTLIKGISASVKSISPDHYWVPADSLGKLLGDPNGRDLFFGLLFQQYGSINFDTTHDGKLIRLDTVLARAKSIQDSLMKYKEFMETFVSHAQEVSEYLRDLKGKKKSEIDYNDYYKIFNASLDLLQDGLSFIDLPYINLDPTLEDQIREQSKKWLFLARTSGDLYVDIRTQNYSSAILSAVSIVDTVFHDYQDRAYVDSLSQVVAAWEKTLDSSRKKATGSARAGKVNGVVKTFSKDASLSEKLLQSKLDEEKITDRVVKANIDSLVDKKRLLNAAGGNGDLHASLLKYGTFAAAMAAAKNSDDMENAIEAIALPAGSSTIKRVSEFNLSLNAYAGLYGGFEKISGLDKGFKINSYGVTAPIGVAASWGHHFFGRTKSEWSTSIFLSLIDLGTVTAFRFKDTVTTQLPTIQLKDIFSPGLFLSLGIPRTPLSVNLGAQLGPNLRKVNVTGPANPNPHYDYDNKLYLRYSLSVCVDIPVLNFTTRSK